MSWLPFASLLPWLTWSHMVSKTLPEDHGAETCTHPGHMDAPETNGTLMGTAAVGSDGDAVGDKMGVAMMRIHLPAIDSRRT